VKNPARVALLFGLACASCRYAGPRFADRPAVTEVGDDAPIPMPRRTAFLEQIYLYEVYLRRALVTPLDPVRVPPAGDVNALDEVPRSSWFDPGERATGETQDGPPVPPLAVLAERPDEGIALSVTDARGLRYELRVDHYDHPELRTGAAAVGARLMRALGYRAAETYVMDVARGDFVAAKGVPFEDVLAETRPPKAPPPVPHGNRDGLVSVPTHPGQQPPATPASERFRVAAIRWPIGVDLGPASAFAIRADDPNDRVLPGNRRSLRALGAVGAFLGMKSWDAGVLRDAYVGEPGRGHVLHYVVSMAGALGADEMPSPDEADDDRRSWVRFFALGLARKRRPRDLTHLALGLFPELIAPSAYAPDPPYEPAERVLPEDLYWAAKRVAALGPEEIDAAVAAGRFTDPFVADAVRQRLERRRVQVMARGLAGVTPCEVARYDERELELFDQAERFGIAAPGVDDYEVELVDAEGAPLAPPVEVTSDETVIRIPLPAVRGDYLVVRVRRPGVLAPRPLEVHFALGSTGAHLVAVRHGR
jgi:hypothetical protein